MRAGLMLAPCGVALASMLAGCAPACPAGLTRMNETQLFFGGNVAAPDWNSFAAATLTPAFPDGFTVYDAAGQWRDPAGGGMTREASRVVQVFGAQPAAAVDSVRADYRARFHQQSVGVVSRLACAAF